MIQRSEITGLILAGGRGTRMGHVNKGLQTLHSKTMVEHVIARLAPQVDQLLINANQDLDRYRQFGFPVVSDTLLDYSGPLAGLECGLAHCQTPYLVCAPCDSPFVPSTLVERLAKAISDEGTQLAVPVTEEFENGKLIRQVQAVFCLLERNLHLELQDFLQNGGRKMSDWFKQLRVSEVVFDKLDEFRNINTKIELDSCTF
jgi:molybdenum cofactor guanylyltransferase